ncbi:sulfatase [Chitinophaga sp. Mgbs1]|uniref:Sulfatase n=1 Tax=Chitinophaga solisilvae TaxID=1233460 RepID=A0A433WFP9_9BACT|nr:sulfatase [Chitinophaga solisilvae]
MKIFRLPASLLLMLMTTVNVWSQQKKPNIIFIFSDDHAYQTISAYGSKLAQTPNIDRIAQQGLIFRNALVTNSICGPSRATLLTGKYSHINGYTLNEKKFNVGQQLFPRLLQQHGYQTAWIGKWHLGNLPEGFDYWRILNNQGQYYNPDFIGPNDTSRIEGYVTNIITTLSENWLNNRDTSKPFFLVVGEKATHREWLPDLQDLGAYDDKTFPLPASFHDDYKNRIAAQRQDMTIDKTMRLKEDLKVHVGYEKGIYGRFTPAQREQFRNYYENVVSREFDSLHLSGDALVQWKYQRYLKDYLSTARSLDRNIGALLDYLDKNGLAENTVVVYASDQGFYMGEHGWFDKRFMYEESLRTPFIIRYPGVVKPGSSSNKLMLNIDWAPTILEMAGAPVPADIQGTSFLPLLKAEETTAWRNAAYYHYYEFPEPHHVYPHFGVRTGDYSLIRFYGGADSWELYDLKKDPQQLHNLYGEKGMEKITAGLKATLKSLIIQYKDQEALKLL